MICGFGIEPELTAKVAGGGWRIFEVGISYEGRTYEHGKKVRPVDGLRTLACIFRYSSLGRRVAKPRDVIGSEGLVARFGGDVTGLVSDRIRNELVARLPRP